MSDSGRSKSDVDALCDLFDDPAMLEILDGEAAGSGGEAGGNGQWLLGSPDVKAQGPPIAGGSPGAASLPQVVAASAGGAPSESELALDAEPPDLPEPTMPLPANVVAETTTILARFCVRCELDLKKLAFGLRHAEYNPRKHSSLTLRLMEPRVTALIRQTGVVSVSGPTNTDSLRSAAKKVARLIQRTGHETARFDRYAVVGLLAKANLRFPVRLDALAFQWRRNAIYEPEMYSGCVFRIRKPRASMLVTSGGNVIIAGQKTIQDAQEILRLVYPVLHAFST